MLQAAKQAGAAALNRRPSPLSLSAQESILVIASTSARSTMALGPVTNSVSSSVTRS
jgi:hypothetical protein